MRGKYVCFALNNCYESIFKIKYLQGWTLGFSPPLLLPLASQKPVLVALSHEAGTLNTNTEWTRGLNPKSSFEPIFVFKNTINPKTRGHSLCVHRKLLCIAIFLSLFFPSPETLVVFSPFIYWSAKWIISVINQALSLHFLRCCHCYEVQCAIKIKLRLHYPLFYGWRMTWWIFFQHPQHGVSFLHRTTSSPRS